MVFSGHEGDGKPAFSAAILPPYSTVPFFSLKSRMRLMTSGRNFCSNPWTGLYVKVDRKYRQLGFLRSGQMTIAEDAPCCSISERTDRVPFDLLGELVHHVDLALCRASLDHAVHELGKPRCALSAGRALAARLVRVELGESCNGIDNVGALVHDDDGSCAKTGAEVLQRVKVHPGDCGERQISSRLFSR